MIKFLCFYKKTILIILLIIIASLANFENVDTTEMQKIPHLDKIVHFCMYLTLTFTFMWENYSRHKYHFILSRFIIIILLVASIGVMLEIFQATLTQTRSGNIADAAANSVGLIFGMVLFRVSKTNEFIKTKIFKV